MRNALILLFIGVLQAHAIDTYSQKTRLSLNFSDTELTKVLDKIEAESEYYFLYNEKLLDTERKVNIDAKNQLISVILDNLFEGTDVKYTIVDRKIILVPGYLMEEAEPQGKQVMGKVSDETGRPLPGVNIQVEGTIVGVITDSNGKYSINLTNDNSVLIFSFVGYTTQKISVAGETAIDVNLVPDLANLQEVVVIGYGTVKKSDLTGSVATISADKLEAFPTTSVLQAMQGKVAGLSIMSNNGAPGSAATIRIRGGSSISTSSEPLWVVDGFPGAPQPEAEDIQSMEVLRDASACAIYGSRGSNGVILVTTKKGNGAFRIEANTSYTVKQISKKYDMLNGTEYAKFANDYTLTKNPAATPIFDPDTVGVGTDWQDVVFRTGALQTYQLAVSGGSDKVKVYSSAKYSKEDGIVINNNAQYFTGKLNLDANISDKTMVGVHTDYGHWTFNNISSQTWYTGSGGITGTALGFEPTLGIFDDNGKYTTAQKSFSGNSDNPYANAIELKNQRVADNVSTNLYLDYQLLKNLRFYTSFALQLGSSRAGNYIPTTLVRNLNNGVAQLSTDRSINLANTAYLTYDKTFSGVHHLTIMLGHDYQSNNNEGFMARARTFPTDNFSFWGLGSGTIAQFPSSGTSKWVLKSFYGRLNYNLNNRYLLTFTGRYDGSSRFGANHKWAFFPSAALRWNVKQESFLQSVSAISQLNLHAGYGSNGNTGISPYQSLATLTANGVYDFVNGSRVAAVVPASVANANLTWETSVMTNIGSDIGLFGGKVNFSVEWYNRESTDMLYYVPLPIYSGYSNMWQNFGDYRNRGIEFTLGSDFSKGAFFWSSNFNISFNKSTVVKLPNGDVYGGNSPLNNVSPFILREGETTSSFYGYVYDGVFQPGDDFSAQPLAHAGYAKYRDINGRNSEGNLTGQPDGTIDSDDRTIIGNANPDFIFGWTNDFTYKNFDINLQITGSYGNQMINCTRMELESMTTLNNTTKAYFKAWSETNPITDVPLVSSETQFTYSTRWVEDASFLRVQNISLGYSLPPSLIDGLKISRCRFYVGVQNAFILTKYSGYDPEIFWNPSGSVSNSNMFRGMDYDAYPRTRNYAVGVNITF